MTSTMYFMQRRHGWWMLAATLLLVVAGCGLYLIGAIGWAQFMFVLGSGTAGASIIALLDAGS